MRSGFANAKLTNRNGSPARVRGMFRRSVALICAAFVLLITAGNLDAQRAHQPSHQPSPSAERSASWLQWGGPHRDFSCYSTGLASAWPAGGPRKIWSRALGDGYSGIAIEGTTLYTGYRRDPNDV